MTIWYAYVFLGISIALIFLMPKYYNWLIAKADPALLKRVREMQSGKSSLFGGNIEIQKILLGENFTAKEVGSAMTAATLESRKKDAVMGPIFMTLIAIFIIVKYLFALSETQSTVFMVVLALSAFAINKLYKK